MTENRLLAGGFSTFLPLLFLLIFLFLPLSLSAGGVRELSDGYLAELRTCFENTAVKVESGEMNSTEAKAIMGSLRERYGIEYNDLAGKIDAIIDEIAEHKKGYLEALNDFELIQTGFTQNEEQQLSRDSDDSRRPSGGEGGTPRQKY